jgi:hypothetical protein
LPQNKERENSATDIARDRKSDCWEKPARTLKTA